MHWLEFKLKLPLLVLTPYLSTPPTPIAMFQRHLREMGKSARATSARDCKAVGHSHSCLWAVMAHTYYSGQGMATRSQLALGWLALAAQDPIELFTKESGFWAFLLVSGLQSCPKVTKGQTHWPHVQSSLSIPSRVNLGSKESIPSEQ